ncbi:hypothetical protein [Salinicoccus sesuvii]|uniref:hypothetical protein n=1 Tax=Salinicoccus sesuvii TaxID=868281 RepID=UPI00360A1107
MIFSRYNILIALLMFVVLVLFIWDYINIVAYVLATVALLIGLLIIEKRRTKAGRH